MVCQYHCKLVTHKLFKAVVVSSAVIVLKSLLQVQVSVPRGPAAAHIVSRLARSIDVIKHENARACVLWLVGQYAECLDITPGPPGIVEWAPDVLRKATKSFIQEVSMHFVLFFFFDCDHQTGFDS